MKGFKIAGTGMICLIVLFFLLGIFAPKDFQVERSITINTPVQVAYEHIQYWRNWSNWSPWVEMDSTMEISIQGVDGTKGSSYMWQGDPDLTGEGKMTTTSISENEEIAFHLHFITPYNSEADGYIRLAAEGEFVIATWGFYGENSFPWNVFMLFFDMESMLTKEFNRGLDLLKNICENEFKSINSYTVHSINFPAMNYASIREEVPVNKIEEFFSRAYSILTPTISDSNHFFLGAPAGFFYSGDDSGMSSDIAAAIPISGTLNNEFISTILMQKQKSFYVDYYGPYDQSRLAYKALQLYFDRNHLIRKKPIVEEYITNPKTESDPSKWLTKIYFFPE